MGGDLLLRTAKLALPAIATAESAAVVYGWDGTALPAHLPALGSENSSEHY